MEERILTHQTILPFGLLKSSDRLAGLLQILSTSSLSSEPALHSVEDFKYGFEPEVDTGKRFLRATAKQSEHLRFHLGLPWIASVAREDAERRCEERNANGVTKQSRDTSPTVLSWIASVAREDATGLKVSEARLCEQKIDIKYQDLPCARWIG